MTQAVIYDPLLSFPTAEKRIGDEDEGGANGYRGSDDDGEHDRDRAGQPPPGRSRISFSPSSTGKSGRPGRCWSGCPWSGRPGSRTRSRWRIGSLATHLANLPSWTAMTLNLDELDIAPVNAPPLKMEPLASARELLASVRQERRRGAQGAGGDDGRAAGGGLDAAGRRPQDLHGLEEDGAAPVRASITSRITARSLASICV